jgi:hypothetical protein
MQNVDRPSVELFLDDSRGIYLPRDFVNIIDRQCWFDLDEESLKILEAGPEHDLYWEAWDDVCESAFAYVPHQAGWQYRDDPTLALARAADNAGNHGERDRLLATLPGTRWHLYQDGACFVVPEGMEWSDDEEWFVWPDDEHHIAE